MMRRRLASIARQSRCWNPVKHRDDTCNHCLNGQTRHLIEGDNDDSQRGPSSSHIRSLSPERGVNLRPPCASSRDSSRSRSSAPMDWSSRFKDVGACEIAHVITAATTELYYRATKAARRS